MVFILSKPGDVSEWCELGDIARWFSADDPDAGAEIAKRVDGIAVRIKVLEHRDYLNICVGATDDDAPQLDRLLGSHDLDQQAIKLGLADIRGVDMTADDPVLAEALASSQLAWLVAGAIRVLHRVPADERAGFFTRAPGA